MRTPRYFRDLGLWSVLQHRPESKIAEKAGGGRGWAGRVHHPWGGFYPAVQDRMVGRALEFPLNMVVKPNVLPLPLERTVMT